MKKPLLSNMHEALFAEMGLFYGHSLPFHYLGGEIEEYLYVRNISGLTDLSHRGQILLSGENSREFIEKITPFDFSGAEEGQAVYTVMTNEEGGIIDDVIVVHMGGNSYLLITNTHRKIAVLDWINYHLPANLSLVLVDDRVLLSLQGPCSDDVITELLDDKTSGMPYMTSRTVNDIRFIKAGFSGEKGYIISCHESVAEQVWSKILAHDSVKPVGLTALNMLRIESGYPVYGKDIDDGTSPVEASMMWAISASNKTFIGVDAIAESIERAPVSKRRIGLLVSKGHRLAREGMTFTNANGVSLGKITSASYSPVLERGICQGYIDDVSMIEDNPKVYFTIRKKQFSATIAELPIYAPENPCFMWQR